jgi:hypothetical protein
MHDTRGTEQETKARQGELFRLAERDYGLTISALAVETGIPEKTLASYNHSNIFARAKMPLWVFVRLCGVIPDDVTSIMVEPAGKCIKSTGTEPDLDELATEAGDYAHEYSKARHPASPGGTAIVHSEAATLHDIRRRIVGRAGR